MRPPVIHGAIWGGSEGKGASRQRKFKLGKARSEGKRDPLIPGEGSGRPWACPAVSGSAGVFVSTELGAAGAQRKAESSKISLKCFCYYKED